MKLFINILVPVLVMAFSLTGFTLQAFAAETTRGEPTLLEQLDAYVPENSPAAIAEELKNLRKYAAEHPKQALPYAYINKRALNGAFTTYFVDVKTGKIKDTFPSLIGYNGIGCGKGQSRPGIFKLTDDVGRAAHPKSWWGNNKKYYDIANVPGGSRCGEKLSMQVVAHSNKNVPNSCSTKKITSRSAGCFTTSPDNWDEMGKVAGQAYIYNVE